MYCWCKGLCLVVADVVCGVCELKIQSPTAARPKVVIEGMDEQSSLMDDDREHQPQFKFLQLHLLYRQVCRPISLLAGLVGGSCSFCLHIQSTGGIISSLVWVGWVIRLTGRWRCRERWCLVLSLSCPSSIYCQLWYVKHNTSKTVTSVFHLHKNRSCCELNVHMNGQRLKHWCHFRLDPFLH